jgi:hypothetical protein
VEPVDEAVIFAALAVYQFSPNPQAGGASSPRAATFLVHYPYDAPETGTAGTDALRRHCRIPSCLVWRWQTSLFMILTSIFVLFILTFKKLSRMHVFIYNV